MKKPGRKILYGAGMLAMSLSLTACDRLFERNGAVYGPPPLTTPGSQDRPEENPDVYGPPPSTSQDEPEDNPDEGDTTEDAPDADGNDTEAE